MNELDYLRKSVEGLTGIVTQLVEERKAAKQPDSEKPNTAEQKALSDAQIQGVLDQIKL